MNSYRKSHYRDNKAAYIASAQARKDRLRAIIDAAKSRPCVDCGQSYPPYVMDLHHVRGKKLFNIGSTGIVRSNKKLQDEIEKCDPICANCHRIRTHAR